MGSGRDFVVLDFKPCIGLTAVSAEPASDPLSPSLSAPPPLSRSKNKKNIKKKKSWDTWWLSGLSVPPTLDFGSGHDLMVHEFDPCMGL